MTALALQLELSIPPEWSRIDPTRDAVGLLVMAMFGDDDLRDALAMVSEELLENAIKYCAPDSAVSIAIRNEGDRVTIAVTNVVDGDSAHLDLLSERVAWLSRFASPAEAYAAAISRVYEQGERPPGEPGLGIVRIAYEGRCDVAVDLSVAGRVTVRAVCPRR